MVSSALPPDLAVDDSTGDLYVIDSEVLRRFDSTGSLAPFAATGTNSLGSFPYPEAWGGEIAVDNSGGANDGHVYVAHDGGAVRAYDAAGEPANFSSSDPHVSGSSLVGFGLPVAVAVDANGCIYVADFNGTVFVFAPNGSLLTELSGVENPVGLAVDSQGDIYVDHFARGVSEYTPTAFPVTASTGYGAPVQISSGTAWGVAVDPANDDLYVNDESSLAQYASFADGSGLIDRFGVEQLGPGSRGVAIDRSGGPTDGAVYASVGPRVDRFGPQVTVPDAVTEPATAVSSEAGTATVNGSVNPLGIETTECVFEYGPTQAYGQTVPCAESVAGIGTGEGPVPVHADLTGLELGDYHYRLVAANANGALRGADRTLSIVAAPSIGAATAAPTYAEASLRAEINPGNANTTYHFEYGTTSDYGSSTAAKTIPAGTASVPVSAQVLGLSEGTEYHFRAVAENSVDTVRGADRTFTTQSHASGPGGCPNEAIRLAQGSTGLPECRAYEQVSPADKAGALLYKDYFNPQASASGDGFLYATNNVADNGLSAGAPGIPHYAATRTAAGWESRGTEPSGQAEVTSPALLLSTLAVSDDMRHALVTSNEVLAPGAVAGRFNIYIHDLGSETYELVTAAPPELAADVNLGVIPLFVGASPDWSRVFLYAQVALTDEPGPAGIYEFSAGQLRRGAVLPDGTAPEGGVSGSVSADGSELAFASQGVGAYLRQGGVTKAISVSHRAGDSGAVQPASLAGFSRDGRYVAIRSENEAPLTEDAPAALGDIYRYDADTGSLVYIEGTAGAASLAFSDDGSTLVFYLGHELLAWRNGQTRLLSSQVDFDPYFVWEGEEHAISPNGRYFALDSLAPLTSESMVNTRACQFAPYEPQLAGVCPQVYLFDLDAGTVACASCAADGSPPGGAAEIMVRPPVGHEQRVVRDSGEVFFDTPTALVPRDANGTRDVYGYSDGRSSLISSAEPDTESHFADTSSDGRDVFFFTNARLVGQDTDVYADVYDARVNGGIAAQNLAPAPASCRAAGCAAPAASSPPAPTLESQGSRGAGNLRKSHARKNHSARRLSRALERCRKKAGGERARCEARAHRHYGKRVSRGGRSH